MHRAKTTLDISEQLLREARAVADRMGVTLSALIEHALDQVVRDASAAGGFKLRDASFTGNGLQPEFRFASWDAIRDEIYPKRGGGRPG